MSDNVEVGKTEGTDNPEVGAQAYAQWICLELNNRTTDTVLVVSSIHLDWGKLYADGDKDHEIKISDVVGTKIQPKTAFKIYSCGRKSAASGTEGTVTLKTANGGNAGSVYWDCPWSGSNKASEKGVGGGWIVNVPKVAPDGAIGLLPVKILHDV